MISITRFAFCFLAVATAVAQSIDDVIIPGKTEIFITLGRTISTKTASTGDKFYGQVAVPVTLNDQIIIPTGTYIIGYVDTTKKPGYVKGKAQLELKFDSIILPDGTTRQIEAIVQSAEGYENSPTGEEGKIAASGSQSKETTAGAAGGAVSGAVIGGIATRSWKGMGVGSAVGAAGGAVLGVFKRGEDVVLRKGTSITVQLHEAIRFVKPQPRNPGTRLKP